MAVPKNPAPRKGRKGKRITALVLLLIAILAAVGLWQKNNIEALLQYSRYSQEELETQMQDNDQAVEDVLKDALENAQKVDSEQNADTEPPITDQPEADPPEDVTEAPQKPSEPSGGEKPMAGTEPNTPVQKPEPKPESGAGSDSTSAEPEQTQPSTYEKELKVIVDKVYALRGEYLKALEDLQGEAVSAYKAIPQSQRNKKTLTAFVSKYISKATALERTCDGKMDGLVRELTALQKKYGQSMELVNTVKYTYANEKSLKKAWYMSELEKRGLV